MVRKHFFFLICAAFLVFWSCDLKEPVFPSWETEFRLPFAVKDFILGEELVNDTTIIIKGNDPDAVLWLSLSDSVNLETFSSADLSIEPAALSEVFTLGTLKIDTLEILPFPEITLRSLLPGLGAAVGQTVTIPDTTLNGLPLELQPSRFQRIHFLRGLLRVRIRNNLPVTIGPNPTSGGLRISVISDDQPDKPFAEARFLEDISPGSTRERVISIADKWLSSPLRVEYELPFAETNQQLITNDLLDDLGLSITLELVDVESDEAVAKLSRQTSQETIKVGYDPETRLREAQISRGRILLAFANHIDLDSRVQFTIPAIRNAQNQPYSDTFILTSGGTLQRDVVLDGFRMINPNRPGELIDSLEIDLSATTFTPDNLVHVRSTDSVAVEVITQTIFFDSFSGDLAETSFEIEPIVEENIFDDEGFEGGVELEEVLLTLRIFSEVELETASAEVRIAAFHRDNSGVISDSAALTLQDLQINGGRPGNPGVTEVVLSGRDHPPLLEMINILPNLLKFSGQLTLGGTVEIEQGNRFWSDYVFETPIRARLTGLSLFEGAIDSLTDANIDELVRDAAEDNLLEASLNFTVTNHTPLGGTMRFILSADRSDDNLYDSDYDTSLVIIDSVEVPAAPVDPQTGLVNSARETGANIRLNRRQIQLFRDPPLYYGYRFRIADTEDFVTLRYSDFLRMLGDVNIKVLIKGDEK